jgi:hypothetical protein
VLTSWRGIERTITRIPADDPGDGATHNRPRRKPVVQGDQSVQIVEIARSVISIGFG